MAELHLIRSGYSARSGCMERGFNRTLVVLGTLLCLGALAAAAFADRSGSGGGAAGAGAPATNTGNKVVIKNFKYMPAKLEVKAGTKVTWMNTDSTEHTARSDSGDAIKTGAITKGQSKSATLSKPGTYAYHCDFHPFMHGTIVVR